MGTPTETEVATSQPAAEVSEPKTLPERLKFLRNEKGLSQVKLSEHLGCSITAVKQWEWGTRPPKGTWIRRLCWFFNVTEFYLKNGGPRIPTTGDAKARKLTTGLTTKAFHNDEAIATAVDLAAEDKFIRGLRRLNLTEEQIQAAVGAKEFKNENILDTVIAVGGMIDRQIIFLMTSEMNTLNRKINDTATEEKVRQSLVRERAGLHYDIANFARLNQSGLMLSARVQQIWAELNEKKKDKKVHAVLDLNG
jgi:transcriptional regulator with XRE-family HTH domain